MKVIGLTGGIATGKSTASEWLKKRLAERLKFFDCDLAVHDLLCDSSISEKIATNMKLPLGEDGFVDRTLLREVVFSDQEARRFLESILHPKVRKECLASLEESKQDLNVDYFVADIPLLFENPYKWPVDFTWTVACRPQTQLLRLMRRSNFNADFAERIISSQKPIGQKIELSDIVLWNEGPPDCLYRQLDILIL